MVLRDLSTTAHTSAPRHRIDHANHSPRFTEVLTGAEVRISMDGRGRWMDNVFIARLWRSLKL